MSSCHAAPLTLHPPHILLLLVLRPPPPHLLHSLCLIQPLPCLLLFLFQFLHRWFLPPPHSLLSGQSTPPLSCLPLLGSFLMVPTQSLPLPHLPLHLLLFPSCLPNPLRQYSLTILNSLSLPSSLLGKISPLRSSNSPKPARKILSSSRS